MVQMDSEEVQQEIKDILKDGEKIASDRLNRLKWLISNLNDEQQTDYYEIVWRIENRMPEA